jgi:flagellar basal body L-ring protein FlgH
VVSSQVGQLSIRYFGNGLMKDNLKPGWLIRILNKIF